MKPRAEDGLDALLAFLSGAAVGGAAAGWLALREGRFPGGHPGAASRDEAPGVGATEASLGRIHALLGEIRALMRPKEGAGRAEGSARAERAARNEPGAAAPDSLASRASLPGGGAEAGWSGGTGKAPEADVPRPREAWRRPDRIGYVRSRGGRARPDAGALTAGALAIGGAAAAWALARKDGAPAALSAGGGFLLVSAWALWRRGAAGEGRLRKAGPRWTAVRVLGRVGPGGNANP
jgi:hypothetical protein